MHERLDVLVVDDDVTHASSLAKLLRDRYDVRIALGLREAVHAIATRVPKVIICAHEMFPFSGDALLDMIGAEHPEVRRVLFKRRPVAAAEILAAIGDE